MWAFPLRLERGRANPTTKTMQGGFSFDKVLSQVLADSESVEENSPSEMMFSCPLRAFRSSSYDFCWCKKSLAHTEDFLNHSMSLSRTIFKSQPYVIVISKCNSLSKKKNGAKRVNFGNKTFFFFMITLSTLWKKH